MTDHEEIMICALRYALGRRTYVVSDTCRYIIRHLNGMSEHCKDVMIDDIKKQEPFGYGDSCDEVRWLDLLYRLEDKDV